MTTVEPLAFLEATWGAGYHSVLWNRDGRMKFRFTDRPGALLAATVRDFDVWWSAHPMAAPPQRGRGRADDVAEVVAIPADLDWQHPSRRTEKPLPSEAEVRAALARLGADLGPSVTIHSGHGLQPWWLLDAPIAPDRAVELIARLDALLESVGLENGRSDLASIMRIPGTRNWKDPTDVVDVVVESGDLSRRFTPEYLERHLPASTRRPTGSGGTRHQGGPSVTAEQYALLEYVTEEHGAHSPRAIGGELYLWRPGKDPHGTHSGTIIVGERGEALFTVFSSNWGELGPAPPEASRSYVLRDGRLVRAETVEHPILAAIPVAEEDEVVVETFWTERPVFEQVRRAAYARGRSAEAVLAGVLARVALLTPPSLRLPPIVGTWATVDVIVGLVGPPGSGKSSSYGIAGELIPIERTDVVDGAPLGSGEGIAEAYYGILEEEREDSKGRVRKVKVRKLTRAAALIYADEGQSLVDLGRRRGSILFQELRKAWSGQTLGQANAADETRRLVPAGRYRFVLVAGWQPEYAAEVLADAVGGLPQRIYWASTLDTRVPSPDERPAWPGPLTWSPPATIPGRDLELEPSIVEEVRALDWARQTGRSIADDLDAHAGLLRLKLAALLALLDERTRVARDDWRLAGELLDTSTNRRRAASAAAGERVAREHAERNRSLARRDAALEDDARSRALERAARAVGRRAARDDGEVTNRDLARAIASRDRELVTVDEALELAVERAWIAPSEEGERWVAGSSRPS